MKKRLAILIAVLICCTLILASCSNPLTALREFFNKKTEVVTQTTEQPQEEMQSLSEVSATQPENSRATVLYYKDDESFLVPVMRYIPKGDLGIAKAALSALIYNDENVADLKPAGLTPTLPMRTKILGAVVKENGLAIVDFSEEFLNFSSAKAEELGIKAVVYTLTEFPNIKSVEIRVEGASIKEMPQGTKVGTELKRTEINLKEEVSQGEKLSKVVAYYQKKGSGVYSYFVPVTKLVSGFKNSVEASLSALLEGPTDESSLVNPFPEGTKLLGVQVKDGIAYVNFSAEIRGQKNNKTAERAMVKAVTLTLGEYEQISKVKFFVDGKITENAQGIGSDSYVDVPVFVNFYE